MIKRQTISDLERNKCTGCGVCSAICKVKAITMKPAKDGFYYPIIDKNKCVNCGMCYNNCHLTSQNKVWNDISVYAGSYIDPVKLCKSSSGGAATAISEYTLSKKGRVFGVKYSSDYRAEEYYCVSKIAELDLLKTSKYAQSHPPQYEKIKQLLENNIEVTFFGLPCQCDALHCFLGKNYDNLLIVSLVCHGPTSLLVLKKYIDELEDKYGKLKMFSFRYKKNGYTRPSCIYCKFDNGKEKILPFITSSFGYAFELLNRKSCSVCHSKYPNGYADIIIGDFWGGKDSKSKQSEKGESLIILRNHKKMNVLKSLSDYGFIIENAEMDGIEKKNPSLVKNGSILHNRDRFVKDLQSMSLSKAVKRNTSNKMRIKNALYFVVRSLIPHKLWSRLR